MIKGTAVITIETDGKYTTQVSSKTDEENEVPLTKPAIGQLIAAAIDKAITDLTPLAAGALKHRRIVIQTWVW